MNGDQITIVNTLFISQMKTIIRLVKRISDSANQSMGIIGQRVELMTNQPERSDGFIKIIASRTHISHHHSFSVATERVLQKPG